MQSALDLLSIIIQSYIFNQKAVSLHIQWNPSGKARNVSLKLQKLAHFRALFFTKHVYHYCEDIMGEVASQITSLTIVYSTVYSDADQRKHQSSASLAFVWGSHRGPLNSPYKWPVTRKMFPFDDVIMFTPHYRPPLLKGHHLCWPL